MRQKVSFQKNGGHVLIVAADILVWFSGDSWPGTWFAQEWNEGKGRIQKAGLDPTNFCRPVLKPCFLHQVDFHHFRALIRALLAGAENSVQTHEISISHGIKISFRGDLGKMHEDIS